MSFTSSSQSVERQREMSSSKQESNLSILMFPYIAHGHISPYLELAKHLCKHNFTISFCSTAINLKSITQSLQDDHRHLPITLLELHLPSTPDLPPELHSTKHAPPHLNQQLQKAFQASKSSFTAVITSLNPDMLIYDAFQPWAASIAASLGIPAVHFATTGAAAYSFFYHVFTKKDGSAFPHNAIYLRPHEWKKLQDMAASHTKDEYDDDDEVDGFVHFNRSSDVVLMKTSKGLEGKYMDYLSLLSEKKIVSVGPLITPPATTSDDDDSNIIEWLSKKEKLSTVFISLGSENYMSKNQMQEMAKGLEASNANFIWAIRFPQGERVEFPEGFLDRVGERGLTVEGWAPQAKILSHPSIFAFVSHCGMSSTIESVYFGVPIIGIPVKLDQPLNARLVVEAGVGVEVVRDENGEFSGGEVAAAIERVREKGEEMRFKAAEMSDTMKEEEESAVSETAEHLRRICMDYCKRFN